MPLYQQICGVTSTIFFILLRKREGEKSYVAIAHPNKNSKSNKTGDKLVKCVSFSSSNNKLGSPTFSNNEREKERERDGKAISFQI